MAGAIQPFFTRATAQPHGRANTEPAPVRWLLTVIVLIFLTLFLLLPLIVVFREAFAQGVRVFFAAFEDPASLHAIRLTLLVAAITVPLNTIFGLTAAYCLTRFRFTGRNFLGSLIDLPLWVSPVIGGLLFVLLFGSHGWLPLRVLTEWTAPLAKATHWIVEFQSATKDGPTESLAGLAKFATGWLSGFADWLADPKIIFAVPGIVLATIFVTFPFVARGLIPLMQAQGYKEEEAALTLGANGWQIFWRITLPKIKWGLIYGVILCNARSMGEFGAVSVVSGHIRNRTNTMPLNIEILYSEYQFSAAFAIAALLSVLALVTLVIKSWAEWHAEQQIAAAARGDET